MIVPIRRLLYSPEIPEGENNGQQLYAALSQLNKQIRL